MKVLILRGKSGVMNFLYIVSQNLDKVNNEIKIDKSQVIQGLQEKRERIYINFGKVFKKGGEILKIKNKGEILLEFRRYVEMLLRVGTILCVRNVYDSKITAITPENVIFHLDRRYYTDFDICSFMDIFKIETNNFKRLNWGESDILPHLGIILKYILEHYNTTYRFFDNRNLEYHYIYTTLYNMNGEIREIINILNSYHYEINEESLMLYNMKISTVKDKIRNIVLEIKKIENNFEK